MSTKSVLITGARSFAALDLARSFRSAGKRVICADSVGKCLSRYSGAASRYYKIAPPAFAFEAFVHDVEKIILEEKIDVVIPTCEEIFYLSKAKERLSAPVFAENFERLERLHNKWRFYELLNGLRLKSPETHLWKGEEYPGKWILKPVYSRFAARIQVVENAWPAWKETPENPLIAQCYVEGEKLCSYSVCHEGMITAHGVYKVLHAMGIGSAICFQTVCRPEVDLFIKRFVHETRFSGQIAFDFIRGDTLYCLECNPRATSGVHLFERSCKFANAFFKKEKVLRPRKNRIFHEHLFMGWYGVKQREIFTPSFWSHFFRGSNPLWMRGDNRVVAALPLMLWDAAKATLFRRQGFHQAMSRDFEYNGEVS